LATEIFKIIKRFFDGTVQIRNIKDVYVPTVASVCEVTLDKSFIKDIKSSGKQKIDGKFTLTPGLVDIHTHGVQKFVYQRSREDLVEGAKLLAQYGTTTILPTLIVDPEKEDYSTDLNLLSDTIDQIDSVNIPGFHLEGPFVGVGGAACPTLDGDVKLLDEMIHACRDKVTAVSIAPEVPGILPVIERLLEFGVVPFITHTKADVEQTVKAIEAGARHATHFYDVFHSPDIKDGGVRPVGVVETVLADERCSVDFICDGVHVNPMAIKATLAAKGYRNIVLITDSNIGAGLPEGIYDTPWGFKVKVVPGKGARVEAPGHPKNGRLAGSSLTMDEGINNLLNWLDIPQQQIWSMGTSNPARVLNLKNKGKIEQACDADLVLWKKEKDKYRVVSTWVMGKCVYRDDNVDLSGVVENE
jgi:N-acetylglucosamine-6-phosphate deacetylase